MADAVMKRVLVTGATGFIGRHVLECLRHHDFIGVGHVPADGFGENVVVANLLDKSSVSRLLRETRPTRMIHLAWEATPGTYWTDPVNKDWVNASEHLYREFLEHGGKHAVFAGSVAEYKWNSKLYSENSTEIDPATLYGQCKARLFKNLTQIQPKSFAWARLFYLYGPFEPGGRLVSSAFQSLLKGKEFPTTDGDQIRDYLHVNDVASALVKMLDKQATGAVNIASGDRTKVKDILQAIGKITGRSDLIQFGRIPQRPNDPPEIVADNKKLTALGWKPKFTIETGLQMTFDWWKKHV